MVSIARVSVFGPDRVGFVAAIADYLFSAGVSLGDTTFAALGSGAEFVALCDLPDGMTPDIRSKRDCGSFRNWRARRSKRYPMPSIRALDLPGR